MKILAIIAAGTLAASAMAPLPAAAAPTPPQMHGWKWKKVCTVRWHHGRKWKQCRKVRVRW